VCVYVCVCMAFLTDEIQFNIILTVVVFFQYRLFIYSFPLSLVSYRPVVDNASAVKRITAEAVEWKKFRILLRATTK